MIINLKNTVEDRAPTSSLVDERADPLSHHDALNVAVLVEVKDHNGQVILAAHRDGRSIHHPQPESQHVHVADGLEHGGILHHGGIVGVDAVDFGRLQDGVGLDLHGEQRGRRVGGEVRTAGATGEDHDAAFFEVADCTAPDKRLGHLVHLDGAHHARPDALFLQRILQGQGIDDRGQHAHVIGGNAVHGLGLLGHAAEEVAAAHYDRDLNSQPVHFGDFGRDFVHPGVIDAEALPGGQRLTGYLEKNAFINWSVHFPADTYKKSNDSV